MAAALLPMPCKPDAILAAPNAPTSVCACAGRAQTASAMAAAAVIHEHFRLICARTIRCAPNSVNGFDGAIQSIHLFSNTKLTENLVEQILGGGLANDFADGVGADAEIHSDDFEGTIGLHACDAVSKTGARAS